MTKIKLILVGIVMALVASLFVAPVTAPAEAAPVVAAAPTAIHVTQNPLRYAAMSRTMNTECSALYTRIRSASGKLTAGGTVFNIGRRTWYIHTDFRYNYCVNPPNVKDWVRPTGATAYTNREGTHMKCGVLFTNWRWSRFTYYAKDFAGRAWGSVKTTSISVPCAEDTTAQASKSWSGAPKLYRTSYGVPRWKSVVEINYDDRIGDEDGHTTIPYKSQAKQAKMGKSKYAQ